MFKLSQFFLKPYKYYLDKEKTHVIKISYKRFFKDFTVEENGIIIGKFTDKKEALQGKSFRLRNGQQLFVRLRKYNFWEPKYSFENFRLLEILLDNEYVKGSRGHPDNDKEDTKEFFIFFIGLMVILALIMLIVESLGYEFSSR